MAPALTLFPSYHSHRGSVQLGSVGNVSTATFATIRIEDDEFRDYQLLRHDEWLTLDSENARCWLEHIRPRIPETCWRCDIRPIPETGMDTLCEECRREFDAICADDCRTEEEQANV